jgi:hypothetical protein
MARLKVRLSDIDSLIDSHLMTRKCTDIRHRSRCECGHHDGVHERVFGGARHGRCHGGSRNRPCQCPRFVPYSYQKEQARLRNRYRAFAFDLLRMTTNRGGE